MRLQEKLCGKENHQTGCYHQDDFVKDDGLDLTSIFESADKQFSIYL